MKLKRLMALVMSIALTSASFPFVRVAAQASNQAASNISGTVARSDKSAVAAACVRLRNVDTGTIVGRTVSDASGAFSIAASESGTYLVEVVNCADGGVLAVSDPLNLAGPSLTLKTVVVLPAAVAAGFFSSTAFLVLAAASGAGITAIALRGGASVPAVSSPEQ